MQGCPLKLGCRTRAEAVRRPAELGALHARAAGDGQRHDARPAPEKRAGETGRLSHDGDYTEGVVPIEQ